MIEWGALGWKIAEPVLRLIGGTVLDRYLQYKIRRDIRRGSEKLSVLLTRLADDTPTDSFRTTLYETIRRELGDAIQLTNWPDIQVLGDGHEYDIERRAYEKVQKLLKDRNCDLMISGRVKGKSTDSTVLSLRFTVAEATGGNPENYRLTDTFDLPADFIGRLGAAITARVVVSAAPAVHMSGHYIVPLMRATAERFQLIVKNLNPGFDADTRGSLLFSYALVLSAIGRQAGSNEELGEAVTAYRDALLECTRERVPLQWAMTQNNLGAALRTLGARESGTARLEEAVAAFHAALLEWTRERAPLNWATTQNNLGTALGTLAERESGTARLEQAVAAFHAALLEWTRERVPLDWAATQNNLGNALLMLGARESGTARLEQAVAAYRAALLEYTRERVPLDWAMTQNNLGNALQTLGARESGTVRLEEAVAAYRDALLERTRERVPLNWATSTGNQGVALMALAERRVDPALAGQAVAQIEAALVVTRDGGHAPNAAYYEARLKEARALRKRLKRLGKRSPD